MLNAPGLIGSLGLAALGVSAVSYASAYLPTVSASPTLIWGAKAMKSGYSGNLFQLKRTSDNATLDVTPISSTNPLPDFDALLSWCGGYDTTIYVKKIYDQSGNGWDTATIADANAPRFDLRQLLNGCAPFIFDSVRTIASGGPAQIPKVLGMTADGFSVDRQSVSVFWASDPFTSAANNTHWELRPSGGATNSISVASSVGNAGFVVVGNAGWVPASICRAMPCVMGVTSSASDVVFYNRETTVSRGSAFTSATMRQMIWGNTVSGVDYYTRARNWGMVMYPAALNSTDANAVIAAMRTHFGIRSSFDKRLVFLGDSIMEGYGYDDLTNLLRNLNVAGQVLGSWGSAEIFNLGINGDRFNDNAAGAGADGGFGTLSMITDWATPLYTAAYGNGKCIYVCNTGHNDISAARTSSQINTDRATAATAIHALGAGAKYVQETILPEATWNPASANDNTRLTVNTAIRAKSSGEDTYADTVANATIGADASTDDTSLYRDGTHTTKTINALRAPIVAAAL